MVVVGSIIQVSSAETRTVVAKEVQRVPPPTDEVPPLGEDRGFRLAFAGSSARKLKRSGSILLGGPARILTIHRFTPSAAERAGAAADLGISKEGCLLS
jgi:hypothetical protein